MWIRRSDWGDDLVRAYAELGGVAGALASEAEKARLALGEQGNLLLSVMVRLIRLGTTGGVTRRVAPLSEFDVARRDLITKLSTDEFGRLLLVTDDTVEVAHEALITQWAWLNDLINERGEDSDTPRDIRRLEQLEDRALAWLAGGKDIEQFGSTGAELEAFQQLQVRRSDWLSEEERQFISVSAMAVKGRHRRTRILYGSLAALLIAAIAVVVTQRLEAAALEARTSESELGRLVSDARRSLDNDDATSALRVAGQVLKSTTERDSHLRGAALEIAYAGLQRRIPVETFEGEIVGSRGGAIRYIRRTGNEMAVFERKGDSEQQLATMGANYGQCNFDFCIDSGRIFVIDRGSEITLPQGYHPFAAIDATSLLATNIEDADDYSSDIELFRIDFQEMQPRPLGHFSGDPEWGKVSASTSAPAPAFIILGDGGDNGEGGQPAPGALATIFRGGSSEKVPLLAFGSNYFPSLAVFDADAHRLVTAPGDPSQGLPAATVWDAATGRALASAPASEAQTTDAVVLEGAQRFVTGSATGLLEIFNAVDGQRIAMLASFPGGVTDIDFDPVSGRFCALWSTGVIGIWDAVSLLRLERISLPAQATATRVLCRDGSMYVPVAGERKIIQRWNIASDWRSELRVTYSVPPNAQSIVGFGFDQASGAPAIDYASDVGDCTVRWTAEIGTGPCVGQLLNDLEEDPSWTLGPAPDDLSKAAGNGYFVEGNQFCIQTEASGAPTGKACPVVLNRQSVAYVQTGESHWFLVTRDDEALSFNLFVLDTKTNAKVVEIRALPFGNLDGIVNLEVDEKLENLFVFRSDETIQIWKLRERSLAVDAQSRFIFQGVGWRTQALDLKRGLLATYGDGVVRIYRYDVPLDEIVRSIEAAADRDRAPFLVRGVDR